MIQLKRPYKLLDKKKSKWEVFYKNRSRITSICLVFILLTMIAFQIPSFFFKSSSRSDILLAETIFARWKANPEQMELFDQLQEFLQKRPCLQRRFEGLIAQIFMHNRQFKGASPFLKVSRIHEDTPYYAQYAEASLLMAQKSYQEALKLSERLKTTLISTVFPLSKKSNLSTKDLLYGFNLIRIGFLHKNLSHARKELETWKEVEEYLRWGKNQLSQAQDSLTEIILDNFREKQILLPDFIESRKSVLKHCLSSDND